jgi:hypothetical protein
MDVLPSLSGLRHQPRSSSSSSSRPRRRGGLIVAAAGAAGSSSRTALLDEEEALAAGTEADNFYQILGVSCTASQRDIKRAYRNLMVCAGLQPQPCVVHAWLRARQCGCACANSTTALPAAGVSCGRPITTHRNMQMDFHPDLSGDEESAEFCVLLNDIYDVSCGSRTRAVEGVWGCCAVVLRVACTSMQGAVSSAAPHC